MVKVFSLLPNANMIISDEDNACVDAVHSEIQKYLEMLINGVDYRNIDAMHFLDELQSGVKQHRDFEKMHRTFLIGTVSSKYFITYLSITVSDYY